ncbi:uncharacterized protein LOC133495318 isoform X5 [Syngnathoides biaculeatus]|uniref:uncharacterized protein LOC133495318 isoform X5 n=1 Tax=Syngnathoides biaculeatus TaxID=300417 RepID=UPI002ADE0230|nr:uncharacterized protein LOC133495318 isoform X5 [Syngnathoides biaculeatus]
MDCAGANDESFVGPKQQAAASCLTDEHGFGQAGSYRLWESVAATAAIAGFSAVSASPASAGVAHLRRQADCGRASGDTLNLSSANQRAQKESTALACTPVGNLVFTQPTVHTFGTWESSELSSTSGIGPSLQCNTALAQSPLR